MSKEKLSFSKLTEELDNLNSDQIEKSEEKPQVEEAAPQVSEPELIEPAKPEPEAEPEEKEGEVVEEQPEDKVEVTPEQPAPEEEEKPEDKEPEEDKKSEGSEGSEEEVEKSEGALVITSDSKAAVEEGVFQEGVITEIKGAFEAIVKSYSNIKGNQAGLEERLEKIEKSLESLNDLLSSKEEAVLVVDGEVKAKGSEEAPEKEEAEQSQEAESVEKSAQPEEEPEGKAVEYVAKSSDGVGVPEGSVEVVEEQPEDQEEVFNAREHTSTVTNYFVRNKEQFDEGQKAALRSAVFRVKRGEGTDADIRLFKEVVQLAKN